jgi:pyruvate carboxylase subunit B
VKYTVTVGGRRFAVEIQGGRVRLDGEELASELRPLPGTVERELRLDGAMRTFAMSRVPGGWELVWAGEILEAAVVDERTEAVEAMTARSPAGRGRVVVRAPMPGLVVRVEVREGDPVRAEQGVVVLEAMKMENELTAPLAGTVSAVRVTQGQAVEKGAVLVEISGEG